jgi:hypothetical protein
MKNSQHNWISMTSVSLYIHKGGEHRDIFNRGRCTCKILKLSIERKSRKKLLWGSFNQILFDMVSTELAKCPHGVYWDKTESFMALTTDIQGRIAGVRTDEIKSNVSDINIPPHMNQDGFDWKNHQMEGIVGFRNSWWCTRSDGGVFILRTLSTEVSAHTRAIRNHHYDSKLKCSGKTILEKKKIIKVVHTRQRIAVLDETNEVSLFTSTTAERIFQDTTMDNVSDLFAIRDTFFLLSAENKITMIYTPSRSEETKIIERGQEDPFSPEDVEYITSTTFEEVEIYGNKVVLTETETSKTVMLNFDYTARHIAQNMGIRVIYDPELNGHLPAGIHKPVIITKLGMFIFKHVPMFVPCFKELKYLNDLHRTERYTSAIQFFSSDEFVNIENAIIIAQNIGADVHEVKIALNNGRKAENSYIFHFTSGVYKGCALFMGRMADSRIESIRNIEKVDIVHEDKYSTIVILSCIDGRVVVWGIHTGKQSKIFSSNQRSLRISTNKLRAMGIKCEHTSINEAGYVMCPHRDHERTFSPNAIQEVKTHMFDSIKQTAVQFIKERDTQTLDELVIGIKEVMEERLIDAVKKHTDSKNKAAKKLTRVTGLTPSVFIDTISKLTESADLKEIIWSNTKDIFLNITTESLERAKDIMISRMDKFEAETKKDVLFDYSTLLKNTEHKMSCIMWEMN